MSQAITERVHHGALRAKDAAKFIGVAQSTFWRWVASGKLPKGIHLSARATVWRVESLQRFLEQTAAQGGMI